MIATTIRFALSLTLLTAIVGCGQSGGSGVIVEGTIVQNGSPITIPHREIGLGGLDVTLVPAEGSTGLTTESTLAEPDGSFKVLGPGDGIKPGKYKLAVVARSRTPGAEKETDLPKGAFSPEKTTLTVEVPESEAGGTHDIGTIDVASAGK